MREQGGETREEQRWEGGGRRHETRRDSAHPKLYGKEYGTNGRQPARAHVHEDVSNIFLPFPPSPHSLTPARHLRTLENVVLHYARFSQSKFYMSSNTLPPRDPAAPKTHWVHSSPLAGLRPSIIRFVGHDISTVHGSIHYLNDLVITMSLCYSMYAFWFKPPSLPDATDIGNTGWNWNCGPMSLCLCGGVSLDDLLH
ncbi:hypothetical protein B0H10DRAFT_1952957 [Mycena sp. CBHHK59/15]|nr:hypothetical protein B0H10DRAFT_1952957 [Mycena sp. CBHHK59/15]